MFCLFFFNDTATTEIYTLSLHDALPICEGNRKRLVPAADRALRGGVPAWCRGRRSHPGRRERLTERRRPQIGEHTSELQSRPPLVCRLLLEKKKKTNTHTTTLLTQAYPY